MKPTLVIAFVFLALATVGQDFPEVSISGNDLSRGDQYYEKYAYQKAYDSYQNGLSKKPDDSLKYYLRLARVTAELDQFDESENYFMKGIGASDSPSDMLIYSEVLAANEKYDEAAEWMKKYDAVSPETRTKNRLSGFGSVREFKEDALAYAVATTDLNSEESDFSPTLVDGSLVFASGRKDGKGLFAPIDSREYGRFYDLFIKKSDGVVPFDEVNTGLNEGPSTYIQSQELLLVTTNYAQSQKNSQRDKPTKLRIVAYKKVNDTWEKQDNFPLNNDDYSIGHPSFDPENKVLYFVSDQPGGIGGIDIYKSQWSNGTWGQPKNLGKNVNTEGDELFPYVNDGTLYFASSGHPGLGGLDIFQVNEQQEVSNLGAPMNSSMDDFGMVINKDGKTGYFSSNRAGTSGKDDIYSFEILMTNITCKLMGAGTSEPVSGNIQVVEEKSGKQVASGIGKAQVTFEGVQGRRYKVVASLEGYETSENTVQSKRGEEKMSVSISMNAIEKEANEDTEEVAIKDGMTDNERLEAQVAMLKKYSGQIYFDFDKDQYTPESTQALEGVVRVMQSDEKYQLTIIGHTDNEGRKGYNQRLSEKRAKRVSEYLTSKGIASSRIKTAGKGATDPVVPNDTDANKNKNRRVDFLLKGE